MNTRWKTSIGGSMWIISPKFGSLKPSTLLYLEWFRDVAGNQGVLTPNLQVSIKLFRLHPHGMGVATGWLGDSWKSRRRPGDTSCRNWLGWEFWEVCDWNTTECISGKITQQICQFWFAKSLGWGSKNTPFAVSITTWVCHKMSIADPPTTFACRLESKHNSSKEKRSPERQHSSTYCNYILFQLYII